MGKVIAFSKRNTETPKKEVEIEINNAKCDGCADEFSVKELYMDDNGDLLCADCVDHRKEMLGN